MLVTLLGMVTLVSLLQLKKALFPMLVTVLPLKSRLTYLVELVYSAYPRLPAVVETTPKSPTFTFTLYAVLAALAGWASSHVLNAGIVEKPSAGGRVATAIESDFVPLPFALVALTVKVNVPPVVGVPDITPVLALSVKLLGNAPSTLHVIGVSPVAASVWLYPVPPNPFGNDAVVMVGAPEGAIVIESDCVPSPFALVAFTVKLNVFTAAGVPDITPAEESDKPLGNEPVSMLHVMGVSPAAASVWLYTVPTAPLGNDVVVMVGVPVPSPLSPVPVPPLSPHEANAKANVRISAVIDMNLCRENGGGGD
jgi:hypothetical protein